MDGLSDDHRKGRDNLLEETIQKHLVAKTKRGLSLIKHVYKLYQNGSIVQLIVACKKEPCPIMKDAFFLRDGTTAAHFAAQEIDDMFRMNLELFVLKHLDDYPDPLNVTAEEYAEGIKDGRILVITCKHLEHFL